MCVWASMNPGSRVASPRSITGAEAPAAWFPTAFIFPASTSSTPGVTIRPARASNRRAALITVAPGAASAGSAATTATTRSVTKTAEPASEARSLEEAAPVHHDEPYTMAVVVPFPSLLSGGGV